MDSSQVIGGEEECHSSESGWTMYIGSPLQGEEDDDSVVDPNGHDAYGGFDDISEENDEANNDANSDDSMASDASSGPSYRQQPWEIRKAGRGKTQCYKGHETVVDEHSSDYKAKKGVKKNRYEKKNEEVKNIESEVASKGAKKFLVQGSNGRKNLGWEKEIK